MKKTIVIPDGTPEAWKNLLEGLATRAQGQNNDISPLNCSHDELTVMADPAAFTTDELERLETLGFSAGSPGTEREQTFYSFRFGSA